MPLVLFNPMIKVELKNSTQCFFLPKLIGIFMDAKNFAVLIIIKNLQAVRADLVLFKLIIGYQGNMG